MCRLIRTGCRSGDLRFLRRRFGHAARAQGVRPLPRSRGAFSPVSSNRPDLRGIHADFDCHSISCCPVASGRQSRGLLQRARHSKNAKRDAVCLMAFFVSLLQRQGASARRKIIPCDTAVVVKTPAVSFFLLFHFFQTNGRTCPTTVAVPP